MLFVGLQIADVALLDAAATAYDDHIAHGEAASDQDPPAPENCVLHCGCHATHHMALQTAAALASPLSIKDPLLARQRAPRLMAGQGPPVPPPNA